MRSEVAFEDGWDDAGDVVGCVRRYIGDYRPLLETFNPLRAAWAFLSRYLIKWLSGNIKNELLFAVLQHIGMLFLNMGKVSFSEPEGFVMAEPAGVADAVGLHFVTKPFVDMAEVRGVAVGKCTNVGAEIGENMLSP